MKKAALLQYSTFNVETNSYGGEVFEVYTSRGHVESKIQQILHDFLNTRKNGVYPNEFFSAEEVSLLISYRDSIFGVLEKWNDFVEKKPKQVKDIAPKISCRLVRLMEEKTYGFEYA